jgi:penicillin G amidase
VERVTKALLSQQSPTAADMAKVHAERVSIPACAYIKRLKEVEPMDGLSARAREKLLAWPGEMDAERVEPAIYSAWRDALLREVLERNLGNELAGVAWHPANRGQGVFLNRLKDLLVTAISDDDRRLLPPNTDWPSMLSHALAKGVATLRERLEDNLEEWQWRRTHQAHPRHTLSAAFPELAQLLDPPAIPTSGDGDTPLAGSYSPAEPATVTGLSVVRYAFDLADWNNSLWAVPLGSSGRPGSRHYRDQSEMWRQVQMAPMQYDWSYIIAHRETEQQLKPV